MYKKYLAILAIVFLLVSCKQEENEVQIEDYITAMTEEMPEICTKYCKARIDCEMGNRTVGTREVNIEACEMDCVYQTTKGVFVEVFEMGDCLDRQGDECHDYDSKFELNDYISGDRFREYMECMWNEELWECEEDKDLDFSFWRAVYWDTRNQCESYDMCRDKLDSFLLKPVLKRRESPV